ncbi:YqjF family protein [Nocardioides sp.]|uniref:YqjF family protein n=1 Tax=Nocardioides sp. TaxID=35761 RepID=UPI00271A15ED|nr:DUF2071 domain-containing protein [Nocardioides sp.]MDO9458009.1 DUF2071 domain-containing protein [Nocardioides sp.]
MDPADTLDPQGPPLSGRGTVHQWWRDLTFVHWRVDPERVAPLLPRGVRPDVHDGASWVGLIPFTLSEGGFGAAGRPVPRFGTFLETNVRLYSLDDEGRHGVVFRSLEAAQVPIVIGANASLRIPYKLARMSREPAELPHDPTGTVVTYRTRRRTGSHPTSAMTVEVGAAVAEPSPLEHFLTARFGAHTRAWGRTLWVPNTHGPWPLHAARLVSLDDELVAAAGLPGIVGSGPESVLFSSGVHTVFGTPVVVR